MSKTTAPGDPRKDAAAQNAQEGVIPVADLSLLTGIEVARLTKFAKTGFLEHYGEYHGKRFYNFQTIISWAFVSGVDTEARRVVRKGIETELLSNNCPYAIEISSTENDEHQINISWKVAAPA